MIHRDGRYLLHDWVSKRNVIDYVIIFRENIVVVHGVHLLMFGCIVFQKQIVLVFAIF